MSRGVVGAFERSWSGAPGTVPWTWALAPLALLYGAGSALSRAKAERSRRGIPGIRVIAVGGLTAGGSGKSSVTEWLATQLNRMGPSPAVLLRGHRASRVSEAPYVVPDFERYPVSEATARGGDEAAAHRHVFGPRTSIPVAVSRDRFASAKVVHAGYDASIMILDDGWEQPWLRWDELWAVVDPYRPVGNGALLPAGPLRRPASTLREAKVVALVYEENAEAARHEAAERIRAWAGRADILRFTRVLDSITPLGPRPGPTESVGSGTISDLGKAALVSGIGAPDRLERFARAAGIHVVSHAAFPDHAAWTSEQVEAAAEDAARRGAGVILTTEKDEARWPSSTTSPLPVHVLRTRLEPRDPITKILERNAQAAVHGRSDRVGSSVR